MKHGDKAKAKSAKAVSKASGREAGGKVKTSGKVAAGKSAAGGKVVKVQAAKAGSKKPARDTVAKNHYDDEPAFNNPLIGDSFKRAIKKYPNAFRRLTD